jgi:hypothetical protein
MFASVSHVSGSAKPLPRSVHVISVGIDIYGTKYKFRNCVSDAVAFAHKIRKDNTPGSGDAGTSKTRSLSGLHNIEKVHSHVLVGTDATLANIQSAFQKVIDEIKPNDVFIFFFAGITSETSPLQTVIVPHLAYPFREDSLVAKDLIDMSELSGFMEQIRCKYQLVISESGVGSEFAKNLMGHLFESNHHIAKYNTRDRIIITSNDWGLDNHYCLGKSQNHGPLMSYILKGPNVINVFKHSEKYEFDLIKNEVACPVAQAKYFSIFKESSYRDLLLRHQAEKNSRGAKTKSVKAIDTAKVNEAKSYAFVVATNEYMAHESWEDLKNPINDGKKVAKLLREKYDVEVSLLVNQNYDQILDSLDVLQSKLDSNDRFIFFIAGHGYYRNKNRSGYLVFADSKELDDDPSMRHSYMQMATLNHRLNYMPCKQVLAIFDVCFGAEFDPSGAELELSTYKNTKMDLGLDDFIERKNHYTSRIFMASGKYEVPDYWDDSKNHSPFAAKIISALSDEQAFICPGKLFNAVDGNASESVLRKFGDHEVRGDFLLKVN